MMRRMRLILALTATAAAVTLSVAAAPPAAAHFCSVPAEINVGESVLLNIGVAAEAKPVRGVDIAVPEGFELKEPVGYLGYEPTVSGKWVHFEGGEIAPYQCHYFAFEGQATRKGRLVARIVTTDVDGKQTNYNDLRPISQFPAQLIYAGVPIPDPAQPASSDSSTSVWVALAVAVGAGVLVVGGAYAVNRRRSMT
ncbi:MAG: hypothetical protein QOI61_1818 [Actinomycetota bacterium]|jgi:uncharacterized protein YcnI